MQKPEVREYYDILAKKQFSLKLKRVFDVTVALILLVVLSPLMITIAMMIKKDSEGTVFYRQKRVTTYGKMFKIHKFRTMVVNADQIDSAVTVNRDSRITKVGEFLRKYRLDELPQLIDVLNGDSGIIGITKKNLDFIRVSLV